MGGILKLYVVRTRLERMLRGRHLRTPLSEHCRLTNKSSPTLPDLPRSSVLTDPPASSPHPRCLSYAMGRLLDTYTGDHTVRLCGVRVNRNLGLAALIGLLEERRRIRRISVDFFGRELGSDLNIKLLALVIVIIARRNGRGYYRTECDAATMLDTVSNLIALGQEDLLIGRQGMSWSFTLHACLQLHRHKA